MCVRVDPVDRATLAAEQRRLAASGQVADLSELVRRALRATYANEAAR
jgi:hypothetical protein